MRPSVKDCVTSNYVEGHNLAIEYRDAEGKLERLPALAAELDGPGRLLRGQGGGCASGHNDINLERNHQGARECSDCDAKLDVHQRAKTPRGPRGKEPAAGGVPTCTAPGFLDTRGGCQGMAPVTIVDP